MALETLKDIKEVNGFEVTRGANNFSKDRPIFIHDETNQIAFQLQSGPIKETEMNGCQVDELIHVAKLMVEGLNKKFPCRQNSLAVTKLEEALHWLNDRRNDRTSRGVEGHSKV